MKPNLRAMPPVETPALSQIQFQPETDGAFQISPFTGVLAPYKNEEFLLTFRPEEVTQGLYGIKCQDSFLSITMGQNMVYYLFNPH